MRRCRTSASSRAGLVPAHPDPGDEALGTHAPSPVALAIGGLLILQASANARRFAPVLLWAYGLLHLSLLARTFRTARRRHTERVAAEHAGQQS